MDFQDQTYPGFTYGRGGGDPSGEQKGQATDDTPFRILRKHGITMVHPTATNNPTIRVAALDNPMRRLCMDGKPAFMISPKAKTLRKGLQGGYCYKRVGVAGEPRYHDKPDKNDLSHVTEACQYLCQQAGEGVSALVPDKEASNWGQQPAQPHSFDPFDA